MCSQCYPISLNDTKWDINKTFVAGGLSPPFPPSLLPSFPCLAQLSIVQLPSLPGMSSWWCTWIICRILVPRIGSESLHGSIQFVCGQLCHKCCTGCICMAAPKPGFGCTCCISRLPTSRIARSCVGPAPGGTSKPNSRMRRISPASASESGEAVINVIKDETSWNICE